MSLEIDFENMEGYVHATVSGTFTKESALPLFEKLLIYATVTRTFRALIDCRKIEGDMPISELYAFSQRSNDLRDDYDGKGMINDLRNAYLFNPEYHDMEHIHQGVSNPEKNDFLFTYDHDEAVNWLSREE